MRPRRYINEQGALSARRIRLQEFHIFRLSLISILFILLFFTNPAHLQHKNNATGNKSSFAKFIGRDPVWITKRRYTDYVLFSLTKTSKGVGIGIAKNEYPICEYYGRAPAVCEWVSDNFCHEMEISARNRPFLALRLLQMLKIASYVLDISYKYGTLCPPAYGLKNPFNTMLSTLYQPRWYSDLLSMNLFIYPCFELVDRIATAGTPSKETAVIHFSSLTFTIVIVAGGIANAIGTTITNEKVRGMKGSIAAALGFICASKPNKIMIDWLDLEFTSGEILFSTFAVTAIANLFGFEHFVPSWKMGDAISWTAGGLLGYGLFQLTMKHYNLWWWSF